MRYVLFVMVFLLVACGTSSRAMNKVSVGMTKEEVIKQMGTPHSTSAQGKMEYMVYTLRTGSAMSGYRERYFVRIIDGRVESYGRMGDFDSTKDPTLNVNIRNR